MGKAGVVAVVSGLVLLFSVVASAAQVLPPPEVPQGMLTISEYWGLGAVVGEGDARIAVRVMRLRTAGEPPEFGVELVIPAAAPGDIDVSATVPDSAVPGTLEALQAMLAQRKQLESQKRDEAVVAYSPVPDLIITLVQRGRMQTAVVFIQGEAVSLPAEKGLAQLRDLLLRAQGRIRELRHQP